jgi:hypothetical protein
MYAGPSDRVQKVGGIYLKFKVQGLIYAVFKLLPRKGEGGLPPGKWGWTEGVIPAGSPRFKGYKT